MTALDATALIARDLRITIGRHGRAIIHNDNCHTLRSIIAAPLWTWSQGRPLWEVRLKIRENDWSDCKWCYPTEVEKRRVPWRRH